jgi:molybdopterin synthase sulfur carrier subunit
VKLRVKFLASLSELTGVLKTEVEVPDGVTVRRLIDILTERYVKLREELLDERGDLKPMYNILVNGRAIEWLGGLETQLKDGDEVVFIPPAAGGYRDPRAHTRHSRN